ncbi:hypothetical protein BROUX41_005167 [Berkeleyomyces rouxiae]|uniref:uncharacterized protein n=1 Tax=Berkeleyomyces rouxiae TaxID=2035830 RepID=UPI003B81366C
MTMSSQEPSGAPSTTPTTAPAATAGGPATPAAADVAAAGVPGNSTSAATNSAGDEAPGIDIPGSQGNAASGIPSLDVPETTIPESRLPTRKDSSLREFLHKMDDYAPIIPDAVTNYYMTKGGLPPAPQTDPRLAKLLALATQKFIADIAADAYQYSRIRASNTANNPMANLGAATGFPMAGQVAGQPGAKDQGKGGPLGIQRPGYGGGGSGSGQNRTVLTMEDLGMAVAEYGVNVKRSEFYR